jgi:hypothetical protein
MHARQVTIDALMEHFANDVMEMDEFERRLDVANAATTSEELKELLRDLPNASNLPARTSGDGMSVAPMSGYSVTTESSLKEREIVVAVMGGSSRRGRWTPARTNYAVAVMGGTELDFREAVLGPGITEVKVFSVWGGVEIVVPPGLNVESHGIAILGGFDHNAEGSGPPDPMAPTLRITGAVIMAGVDISVRNPGESARDARRRTRLEKREQRRRLRGG